MDKILLVLCNSLSCFIIITILFQFMEERYKKRFHKKSVYVFGKFVIVVCMTGINLINNSFLNLIAWGIAVAILAYFLFYEDIDKPWRRILESEALALCMCVCESLGVIMLQGLLQFMNVENIDSIMLYCLGVTFSKVLLIFLYYLIINRLVRKNNEPYSMTCYVIYVIMLIYSLINMIVIVEFFIRGQKSYFCAINMGCIVLADLYLLYFVKMTDEKNHYENQVKALEQQANIQYEYYLSQIKKYDQTVQILHDVNKHIGAIENLYETNQKHTAGEYAKEIRNMLKPLIPIQYTGNPVLNILLTDKEIIMKEKGITSIIEIDNLKLDFIAPIDVTTIFGNLLDNALEALENAECEKFIYIKIASYHQMIFVRIENGCGIVKWKNGLPLSEKGKGRGLGLLNVQNSIEKYGGDLKLKQENQKFIVEFFLNS